MKSFAHWLSWACSMSPGTSREHVRVARTLRRMPASAPPSATVACRTPRSAKPAASSTWSTTQPAIPPHRHRPPAHHHRRRLPHSRRHPDQTERRPRTPLDHPREQHRRRPPPPPRRGRRDLLADLNATKPTRTATTASPTQTRGHAPTPRRPTRPRRDPRHRPRLREHHPRDRSGEDRSLVIVQVHADHSPAPRQRSRPGNIRPPARATPSRSDLPSPRGRPDRTRDRPQLACDTDLLGAILDTHHSVLGLGRARRLVTRALRRALMIRDQARCQFTGCHQTHHLKAHHLIHWADGGPTDLDNLILLCQFHHTAVHRRPDDHPPHPAPTRPRHRPGSS